MDLVFRLGRFNLCVELFSLGRLFHIKAWYAGKERWYGLLSATAYRLADKAFELKLKGPYSQEAP